MGMIIVVGGMVVSQKIHPCPVNVQNLNITSCDRWVNTTLQCKTNVIRNPERRHLSWIIQVTSHFSDKVLLRARAGEL